MSHMFVLIQYEIVIFLCLCSLFQVKSHGQCIDNNLVQEFDFSFPKEGMLVPREVFVAFTAGFWNPDEFVQKNSLYTLCTGLNGRGLECSDQAFDMITVHMPSDDSKVHEIFAALCAKDGSGCLCHASVTVKCCAPEEHSPQTAEILEDDLLKDVKTLEMELGLKIHRSADELKVVPPWSCRHKLGLHYVIGIKSAAKHAAMRNLLRKGWMTEYQRLWKEQRICAAFVVGNTHHREILSYLELESDIYGDVLLGHDIPTQDSYFNLYNKSLLFMTWVLNHDHSVKQYADSTFKLSQFSQNLKYIAVIDDDVYVRLPALLSLFKKGSGVRDYRGEVFADKFNTKYKPICAPGHRNFLFEADYPDAFLPRYATGNFYILSIDLVHYIATTANTYKPVGSLEDVSVAHLLKKQVVEPGHEKGILSVEELVDKIESHVALSALCDTVVAIYGVKELSVLQHTAEWFSNCSTPHLLRHDDVSKFACELPLVLKSRQKSSDVRQHNAHSSLLYLNQRFGASYYKEVIVYITRQAVWATEVVRSLLLDSFPKFQFLFYVVDLSEEMEGPLYTLPKRSYEKETEIYRDKDRFRQSPDIFVISSVDESFRRRNPGQLCHNIAPRNKDESIGENSLSSNELLTWDIQCQQHIRDSIAEIDAQNVFFINGEAVDLKSYSSYFGNDVNLKRNRSYVILNSYKDFNLNVLIRRRRKNIALQYLSNAAMSFAAHPMLRDSDMQLFFPRSKSSGVNAHSLLATRKIDWALKTLEKKKRSVAYLYFRCDRQAREHMFALLQGTISGVDSLGACDGSGDYKRHSGSNMETFLARRFSFNFVEEAVRLYEPYKFVISFENTLYNGYITEKLTNAFLANAVPIYFGAPDVADYFNNNSFINCMEFPTLEDCARYVKGVDEDDELYMSYLKSPPFADVERWCNFFQWKSDVSTDKRCGGLNDTRNISSILSGILKF